MRGYLSGDVHVDRGKSLVQSQVDEDEDEDEDDDVDDDNGGFTLESILQLSSS